MRWPVFFQSARNISTPLVGQRVREERLDHTRRDGGDVGADQRGLFDVQHITDRGGQDLRLQRRIVVVDGADLADQVHAVEADVVQPADERRDEGRAGLGRQQRLIGREAQRHVDHRALGGKRATGLEAGPGERHLDRDVLGDLGQRPAFLEHALGVEGCHLGTDRAVDDGANLGDDLLEVAARLGDQRGVGGDAVQQAGGRQLADFGHIRRVDKEFHRRFSTNLVRAAGCVFALCSPHLSL